MGVFRHFPTIDRGVQSVTSWIGLAGLLGAAISAIAVWAAAVTPALRHYAPFSYVVAGLLVVVASLALVLLVVLIRRAWRQSADPQPVPVNDPGIIELRIDVRAIKETLLGYGDPRNEADTLSQHMARLRVGLQSSSP